MAESVTLSGGHIQAIQKVASERRIPVIEKIVQLSLIDILNSQINVYLQIFDGVAILFKLFRDPVDRLPCQCAIQRLPIIQYMREA